MLTHQPLPTPSIPNRLRQKRLAPAESSLRPSTRCSSARGSVCCGRRVRRGRTRSPNAGSEPSGGSVSTGSSSSVSVTCSLCWGVHRAQQRAPTASVVRAIRLRATPGAQDCARRRTTHPGRTEDGARWLDSRVSTGGLGHARPSPDELRLIERDRRYASAKPGLVSGGVNDPGD